MAQSHHSHKEKRRDHLREAQIKKAIGLYYISNTSSMLTINPLKYNQATMQQIKRLHQSRDTHVVNFSVLQPGSKMQHMYMSQSKAVGVKTTQVEPRLNTEAMECQVEA